MAEQNRESSMEEILSSIKRIIAEDKAIDEDRPVVRRKNPLKPALQAVPDAQPEDSDDEILELTDELAENQNSSARGVFGDGQVVDLVDGGVDDEGRYIITGFNPDDDNDAVISASIWRIQVGVRYEF